MKKWIGTYLIFLLVSCNGENIPDCFQNAGEITKETVSLPSFTKITVFEKVALVLKQGPETTVEIETGEFLRDEISAVVEGDELILRNENACNFVRDYGITKVYVTAPNLTEVRSSTGLDITSDGVLNFSDLRLISESFSNPEAETTDGHFDLEVNSEHITIVTNGIAFFQLRGSTVDFNVNIAAGDSRVEAENMMAENINVNHRGSNNILVNPQQSLAGSIRGTGDVVSFNRPEVISVEELYRGKLIFKD